MKKTTKSLSLPKPIAAYFTAYRKNFRSKTTRNFIEAARRAKVD